MKRNSKFVMLGVIALTGVTAFTSCSSDESVPVNPTFDGESVKTAFALNVPHAAKGTRMTTTTTQEAGNFRGFQDIYLFPLNAVPADATPFPYVNINLANTGYDADHSTQVGTSARSSQIYQDVNIGVGTNNFLFYAEAAVSPAPSTKAEKFANGILTKTLATTLTKPSEITFDLNPVYTTGESAEYTGAQTALLAILNGVAGVSFTKSGASTTTNWKDLNPDPSVDGLKYQALADLYAEYTKTARNGSGPNVLKTMQALYNNVSYIWKGSTDADVIACCKAIRNAIKPYFTPNHVETDEDTEVPAITIPASSSSPDYKGEYYTLSWRTDVTTLTAEAKDFPKTTFCLPYGAAELTCTSGTFAYNDDPTGTGFVAGSNLKLTDLCFPASLQYFCNTPAKANNNTIDDSTWPTTTATWDSFDWATGWGDVVTSTTRTIALRNNVNYGVAQLAATVKCTNANQDPTTSKYYLVDNSDARDGDATDNSIANIKVVIPDDGFTVTGFLIGGQPKQVGWNFLSTSSAAADRSCIIYDNTMNGTMAAKAGSATGTNYTLVLDNYTTAATQEPVNIAVELTNNSGTDFWGYNGLITAGQTFYLIGQLNPNVATGKTGTITWPTGATYRFPASGTERVFIQDYTTTATFTINDLKKAYSTIPDLRVAKLELGLSVDLSWTAGVTYEVPLGK